MMSQELSTQIFLKAVCAIASLLAGFGAFLALVWALLVKMGYYVP